jgi:hypothetical protein
LELINVSSGVSISLINNTYPKFYLTHPLSRAIYIPGSARSLQVKFIG